MNTTRIFTGITVKPMGSSLTYTFDPLDLKLVEATWMCGRKVAAIQWLRDRAGFGLKEAKDACEDLARHLQWRSAAPVVDEDDYRQFNMWKAQQPKPPTTLGELLKAKINHMNHDHNDHRCFECDRETPYDGYASGLCPACLKEDEARRDDD